MFSDLLGHKLIGDTLKIKNKMKIRYKIRFQIYLDKNSLETCWRHVKKAEPVKERESAAQNNPLPQRKVLIILSYLKLLSWMDGHCIGIWMNGRLIKWYIYLNIESIFRYIAKYMDVWGDTGMSKLLRNAKWNKVM